MLIVLALIAAMAITLAACGKDDRAESSLPAQGSASDGGDGGVDADIKAAYVFKEEGGGYAISKYHGAATDVDIPAAFDGKQIVKIGDNAFDGRSDLTSVSVPSSVTEIGDYAFAHCSALGRVTIAASVKKIGKFAFWGDRSISTVNYLGDLKGWCEIEFASEDSNPLDDVNANSSAKASLYLSGSRAQGVLNIPEGTARIGAHAFAGLTSITGVVLPNGLTSIGAGAFERCSALREVTFGTGLADGIGDAAFAECGALEAAELKDGATSIGTSAFKNCGALKKIALPATIKKINTGAFFGCNGVTELAFAGDVAAWSAICFEGYDANPVYTTQGRAKLLIGGAELSGEINIPDGSAEVGNFAFYAQSKIQKVVLPDSVTKIGARAFDGCSSLKAVVFGKSLATVGNGAFEGCKNIESVDICDLKGWCEINFETLPTTGIGMAQANPLNASDKATLFLVDESGRAKIEGEVNIPAETKKITDFAFCGQKDITAISIPNSVKSIGQGALKGMSGVTALTIPDSVTSIGDYALAGMSGVAELNIPDSVSSIGQGAFAHMSGLLSLSIPQNTSLGANAFEGCHRLVHIKYPGDHGVQSPAAIAGEVLTKDKEQFKNNLSKSDDGVWTYTVGGTAYLIAYQGDGTRLSVGEQEPVNAVYPYALEGSAIQEAILSSKINSVGAHAFENCKSLRYIVLGENIASVGTDAFANCEALKNVYFSGASDRWSGVAVSEGNGALLTASRHYYRAEDPYANGGATEGESYWRFNSQNVPEVWQKHA